MSKKYGLLFSLLAVLALILVIILYFQRDQIAVLNPKGLIAAEQFNLIVIATLLMLIVVIPVFVLTAFIAWKYRATNLAADYNPKWNHSYIAESIWWGLPFLIIVILSVITWKSTHQLNPYKPIESEVKPLTIQVVALEWKWLFIYPEQKIASVNFIQFPEKTPLNFEITADAPMNAFWIPQLGGQIYAMAGMKTKLHLIADEPGSYRGSSANISGKGFSGMVFTAKASSQEAFDKWVEEKKKSSPPLDIKEYEVLSEPSEYDPVTFFELKKTDLFEWILMKPMQKKSKEVLDGKSE